MPNFEQFKDAQNISILIIQMLHYLADGRRRDYGSAAERLQYYIKRNLKKESRARLFLKMLIQIDHADYRRAAIEERTQGYLKKLKSIPATDNLNLLESELIEYERLWGEILNYLT